MQPLRYSLELNASGIAPVLPQARAGKLRLLAIINRERAPAEFAAAIAEQRGKVAAIAKTIRTKPTN